MDLLSTNLRFKKLVDHAETPKYAHNWDAGLDLVATDMYHNTDENYIEYGTGLAVEIPKGYVGLLFPRSSVSKTDLQLANSVGVIDSEYRGELKFRYRSVRAEVGHPLVREYSVGERIGQLVIVPCPQVKLIEVEELSNTGRGSGGFGSSGV